MNILQTALSGVVVIETVPYSDRRGSFSRYYCERELAVVIGDRRIVQINHSRTTAVGAVRGMHYQRHPRSEMKLVRCIRGRVWDVAVDLRVGSPTFLQWHAEELAPENARMLVIPEGCAHGFQVLESDSELLYLHTAFYAPEAEGGVSCNEPRIGISWPLPVTDLSLRDSSHPPLSAIFPGIVV
ncbi:MAG: dTDP-4-dehydrorhamnose 3,5-epimerase [Gallionella sp.]|nr:dTDP-4-dehydrorhamnose 3,5-epimerase [Gallionella sp.]